MTVPELRPIFGFELYAIAADKTVWRRRRDGWRPLKTMWKSGRSEKLQAYVGLCQDGESHTAYIEVLFRETWGPDAVAAGKHPSGRAIGSTHGRAKLNERKVREARRLHRQGWSYKALCARYGGIGRVTLHYALVGKTWQHVV